jgi:hypothetical protein
MLFNVECYEWKLDVISYEILVLSAALSIK